MSKALHSLSALAALASIACATQAPAVMFKPAEAPRRGPVRQMKPPRYLPDGRRSRYRGG